jgi:hypothetical protein
MGARRERRGRTCVNTDVAHPCRECNSVYISIHIHLQMRRFRVSSSHLVHHELVDRNSLACRLAWHLCDGKPFTILCSFIEGKPK